MELSLLVLQRHLASSPTATVNLESTEDAGFSNGLPYWETVPISEKWIFLKLSVAEVLGSVDTSAQPKESIGQLQEARITASKFVETSKDTPKLPNFADNALNQMSSQDRF